MYLLFDLGATKMRLALSADGRVFGDPLVVPTPVATGEVAGVFKASAEQLLAGQVPDAIAGGVTRKHESFKTEITKLFTCPIHLENDAAMVGLGEAVTGAGQGSSLLAYITVSTGVGGARIVEGKIDRSASGFEPGHQYIHVPTQLGDEVLTLEQAVGGRALSERLGQPPTEITDPAVWERLARLLAYGLHNTIVHWSPELLVLGGSMMTGTPAISLELVRQYLGEISRVFPTLPTLKLATLGDFGGLHGALAHLQQHLTT